MLSPESLREAKVVDTKTFKEICEKIRTVVVETSLPPKEDIYYLYQDKSGKFVLEELKKANVPVPIEGEKIVEEYKNARVTDKEIREVFQKAINGQSLTFEEKVSLFKFQRKPERYARVAFDYLRYVLNGRLPAYFKLPPSYLVEMKVPFKPLLKKGKKTTLIPASAVYFLLTDFSQGKPEDKYVLLDNFSLAFIHDDSMLKDFPYRKELENKLISLIKEEKDFYLLKQKAAAFEDMFLFSPLEYYASLKAEVLIEPLEGDEINRIVYNERVIRKNCPDSVYDKAIMREIKKESKSPSRKPV